MGTKIESLNKTLSEVENQIYFKQSFIERLGDPSEWEYSGIVNDCGKPISKCICGHPIRFEFQIINGRDVAYVGSECINNFQKINSALHEKLLNAAEKLKSQISEAKKKAKESIQDKEIEVLKQKWEGIFKPLAKLRDDCYEKQIRTSWKLFCIRRSYCLHSPEYQRKCDYIRWYKKQIESIKIYFRETPYEKYTE